MYSTLTVNLVGRVRRVTWNDRRYLVAPLTSIVPGVLAGSQGPLFYPPNEIQRNVRDWNGIPITNYHPFDPLTGEHLSAQSPGVLDRQGIGTIRNSVYRGKLCHEGWFDEEATRLKAPEVYNSLLNDQPIELSTGLYTENQPAPQGSAYNGRPYTYIARNYKPDHMAILPDQVGACSLQDGCGVLVNKQQPIVGNCNGQCTSCPARNDANFVSEAQRKFLWAKEPDIAESWAHGEHTADKDHKMPEETGEDVHVAKKTENRSMSLFEKMMNLLWFSANAEQGRHPATGQFQGTHTAQATKSFKEAVGEAGVTGMGKQATKDGRQIVKVDKESPESIVESGEVDDNQIDDAPGSGKDRSPATLLASSSSFLKNMSETYNVACALLKTNPEAAQVYNINDELAYNKAWPQARLDTLPESDFAGPSQTFPIANQQDVDWALSLVGKADNPEQVRNKIAAIAGRKGLSVNAFPPPMGGPSMMGGGMLSQPAVSPDSAHHATKQAAGASLQTEHDKSFGHAQAAMGHSAQGSSEDAMDMHQKAASSHEKMATKMMKDGDQSGSDNHLQAAALHRKAAAMHAAVNNARNDPMARFFTTNMPAGGAFQGAKDAGFPPGQAAAMAGKLEGSYEGGGADSGPSKEARSASKEAERLGSSKAHKAAASAHRSAAEYHKGEGNTEHAAAHEKAAAGHERSAKKSTRNAAIVQRGIELGHINSAIRDQLLFALNTSDESGSGTFDSAVQVGGEEEDDDASSTVPGQKVSLKKKAPQMNSAQLNELSKQMFGLPLEAVQGVLTNQARQNETEKTRLILNMTQHLEDSARQAMVANLRKFDLDDLQAMATLNPMAGYVAPSNGGFAAMPTVNQQPVNFLGAGVILPTVNQGGNRVDPDILPLPTMNMDKEESHAGEKQSTM